MSEIPKQREGKWTEAAEAFNVPKTNYVKTAYVLNTQIKKILIILLVI